MERLVEVVQRRARERAQRFVGRTLEVLVEGPSRTDPSRLRGRTRHNKVVNFAGLASPGELVEVEITGATSQTLCGRGSRCSPRGRADAASRDAAPARWVGAVRPRVRTYVRALEQPEHRDGRAAARLPGLPRRGRRAPFRRARRRSDPVLRGAGQVDPQPRARGVADAVPLDDQPVPRLHARLHLLLRPPHPHVPGLRRRPRLRARDRGQGQRAGAAAGRAGAAVVEGRARRARAPTPTPTSGSRAATS